MGEKLRGLVLRRGLRLSPESWLIFLQLRLFGVDLSDFTYAFLEMSPLDWKFFIPTTNPLVIIQLLLGNLLADFLPAANITTWTLSPLVPSKEKVPKVPRLPLLPPLLDSDGLKGYFCMSPYLPLGCCTYIDDSSCLSYGFLLWTWSRFVA